MQSVSFRLNPGELHKPVLSVHSKCGLGVVTCNVVLFEIVGIICVEVEPTVEGLVVFTEN